MTPMHIQMERVQQVEPATMERAMKGLNTLGMAAERSSLERSLQELVKIRASQINGCAMCLDMHTKDARARGESEQRLHLLAAWRESTPFFNARERAALAWTEAVTLLAETHAPDAVYDVVRQEFSDDELVNLTLLIAAINAYNRVNAGLRTVPGFYQPGMFAARDAEPAIA
jgi:AhpD family alkylhydroperoxidase